VHKGQKVEQGQIIAYSGYNAIICENCLYFELRKSGKAVNPLDYLKNDL
jgi:murein DD-endopeptidase MepM/ murein hydrolase activator NlpD